MTAAPLRINTSSVGAAGPSSSRTSALPSHSPVDDGEDHSEYVLAMHDYAPDQPNATCLTFKAGQIIRVCNRDPSGWWDGEVDSRRGWFPSNYVTSEVSMLTDEELPQLLKRSKNAHSHTTSATSASSWSSTPESQPFNRTDHRPIPSGSSMDAYCPRIMIPLLQALSLLQKVARANRITHFQPATACIISAVRSMLSDMGCLPRDATLLQQHSVLAKERKRILADLAALVEQTKKASGDLLSDQQRLVEVESMIKGSGQLFAHVRGFLAVLAQCGVDVEPRVSSLGSEPERRWGSEDGTIVRAEDETTPLAGDYASYWEPAGKTTGAIQVERRQREATKRPRSLSDIRKAYASGDESDSALPPKSAITLGRTAGQQWAELRGQSPTNGTMHKSGQLSISSISSASSRSSNDSIGTPPTPIFPSGPSTTAEVMDALRHTHDNYLSTIAAFIGHAHSHSRTSHASSTGHMYDLVREVVEMVCKLLTIVEAVLRHPGIPPARAQDLRAAKEGLYNVTSTLADSVRQLTTAPLPGVSEEDEKDILLRSATNALKAGSDCVNAVKKCLHRAKGERSFIIELPGVGDAASVAYTPSKFSHAHKKSENLRITTGKMNAMRDLYRVNTEEAEAERFTAHERPFIVDNSPTRPDVESDPDAVVFVDQAPPSPISGTSPRHPPSPLAVEGSLPPVTQTSPGRESRPLTPVSSHRPSEDSTIWEGASSAHHHSASMDRKVYYGDLPPVPETPLPEPPRLDPMRWVYANDHAPDDVAYNSDGQLVGATLPALVERMSPHASVVEPSLPLVFWVTFRQFTTPLELLDVLIDRYNQTNPDGLTQHDIHLWQQQKGVPTRLRTVNLIKTWLEFHFRPETDRVILAPLEGFMRNGVSEMFQSLSSRILEWVEKWKTANDTATILKGERGRDHGIPNRPAAVTPSEVPRPSITKNMLSSLRSKNYSAMAVTDFDPLELARQLTLMECTLYCAIQPEEILDTGKSGASANSVKAVTSLSTVITGWVAESILNEVDTKKRTALVKFWIKLADRCTTLQNFSTPRSILAALDSSTISRLHQTWTGLPQKNKVQLDALRKLADHARNYHEYRGRLRNTAPPAVPFLGLYLTDITFCREGNPSHRTSPKNSEKKLLNISKYYKLARIVQDMQRFQVPYSLKEIPEVQEYLKDAFEQSKNRTDLQDLYRRSLLIEPKRAVDQPPSSDVRQPLFQWATRSQPSVSSSTSS